MTRLRVPIALFALASAGAAIAAADPQAYMPTRLVAETTEPRPGSTVLVGFRMVPKAGWHGYWSNPGDSGLVPTVRWTAPVGVTFGPLLHPAPTLISDSGINSYVHDGPHVLLARMKVPSSIAPGTAIPVKAKLNWAACTATQCVPLSATFSLDLVAGNGAKGPDSPTLRSALAKLPRQAPEATFSRSGKTVSLHVPQSLRLNPRSALFFPDDNDAFPTARGRPSSDDGSVTISAAMNNAPPRSISGVLSDGRSAYRISFIRGEAPAAAERAEALENAAAEQEEEAQNASSVAATPSPAPEREAQPVERGSSAVGLWIALAGALAAMVGGLVFLRRG